MWPSPSDYQDAIQNPRLCFDLPELREAEAARGSLGLPRVASGNFASVYEMRATGKGPSPRGRWAVRCFLRPVSDQERRYHAISDYLNANPLRWLVDFDYHPRGIRVRGTWYPIVTMDWVDGAPLNRHVETLLGSRSSLLALAYQWRGLARDLHAAGIAHGDYQHGNVLVTSGELRLVDYDGMFVPAFAGERSPELGRLNYQHPNRAASDYGPGLDHFPALVIYLSLRALALAPDLWEFHDGENLVLTAADFRDPPGSAALARMRGIEDSEVRALASQMEGVLTLAPCDVPPLETILATAAPAWFIGRTIEAGDRRPTNDQRPTTNDQRPTTNDQRPTTISGTKTEWWKPDAPAAVAETDLATIATTTTTPATRGNGPSLAPAPAADPGRPSLAASPAGKPARPQPATKPSPPRPGPPLRGGAPPAPRRSRAPALPSPRRATVGGALLAVLLTLGGSAPPPSLIHRVGPWSDLRTPVARGAKAGASGATTKLRQPPKREPTPSSMPSPPGPANARTERGPLPANL